MSMVIREEPKFSHFEKNKSKRMTKLDRLAKITIKPSKDVPWCPNTDVFTEKLHFLITHEDGSVSDVATLCAAENPLTIH